MVAAYDVVADVPVVAGDAQAVVSEGHVVGVVADVDAVVPE